MKAETERLFEHYGDILRARGLAERSIPYYQYSLKGFVGFPGDRSLGNATSEDIVSYQIQLGSDKARFTNPRGDVCAAWISPFRTRARRLEQRAAPAAP